MKFLTTASILFLAASAEGYVTQLSTKLADTEDTNYSYESMEDACSEIPGGIPYGSEGQFCVVPKLYTQLQTKTPEADRDLPSPCEGACGYSYSSMKDACDEIPSGVSYGSQGQFCAVPGEYTQLTTKMPFDTLDQNPGLEYSSMVNACEELGGVSYGSQGQFCAVKGKYTQLATKMTIYVNRTSYVSMQAPCEELGGVSFGSIDEFCAVKGNYEQLGTKTPGTDFDYSYESMESACGELGGVSFGSMDQFCAVKDNSAAVSLGVLGTKVVAASAWLTMILLLF